MIGSFITSVLVLGCGYTVNVNNYIAETLDMAPSNQYALRGEQGETARQFVTYPDGSWYLTFDFLKDGPSTNDIVCIVATGSKEHGSDVADFRLRELPAADIGKPVRRRPTITPP